MVEKDNSVKKNLSYNLIRDNLLVFFRALIIALFSSFLIIKLINMDIAIYFGPLRDTLNYIWNFFFSEIRSMNTDTTLYRSFFTIILFLLIQKLTKNWRITLQKNNNDNKNINNVNYLKILEKLKDRFFSIFNNFFDIRKLINLIKICSRFLFYSIVSIYIFHSIYYVLLNFEILEYSNKNATLHYYSRSSGSVLIYYYISNFKIRFIKTN